ncbi:MAG: AI-2E family transporter [Thiohalophilus sp.]|jgi:putative permease
MFELLKRWYNRYFSDPQAVLLAVILIIGFTIVLTMGKMLTPVLAAIVIAYLLEGIVRKLQDRHVPRTWAVMVVFTVFLIFLIFLFLGVVPLITTQLQELFQELPRHFYRLQQTLMQLPQQYSFISEEQVKDLTQLINREIASLGQRIVTMSLASLTNLVVLMVYVVLVPLMVFFFLKDKKSIISWSTSFLPKERALANQVWAEMDQQLGNYVRGKFWEILIVGVTTYITFELLGLKYSLLLSALVGVSVVVPYIGATVVTIPVALVAYIQWGLEPDFVWVVVAYGIIQALDGNVLVPLLFSEVVNLHPVAIIVSVLVFGGLWGFWGVFFAIPLATLVKASLSAWPRASERIHHEEELREQQAQES